MGSIALHAALLFILLHSSSAVRIRAFVPGTPKGTRIEFSYLPGGAPPARPRAKRKAVTTAAAQPKLAMPIPLRQATPLPTAASAPSAAPASTSSNDALGTDDIRIALTTYSPSPKPDLSGLPRGTQGEVVVDVTIDPTGKVADLQILHALGYGVEGMVADTVRTWKFSPATKDGVPVASVQELHFHYGPV